MSNDHIRVAGHCSQVLVAIAKVGHQDVPEDEFRALAAIKYLAHQLLVHARELGADAAERNPLGLDLLPVDGAGGNQRLMAAALQLQRQAHVGMDIAVRAEGVNEDTSHAPLFIINVTGAASDCRPYLTATALPG